MAGYKCSVSLLMIAALLGVCANVSLAAPGLDPERLSKALLNFEWVKRHAG